MTASLVALCVANLSPCRAIREPGPDYPPQQWYLHDCPPPGIDRNAGQVAAEPRKSIGEVLQEADFISLHCPGWEENYKLINAERLKLIKLSSFLINTARFDIIDEAALFEALTQKNIAGAGLDVYACEPHVPEAMLALENVVLLSHLGSATQEIRVAMGMRVVANLQAFFNGEELPDPVKMKNRSYPHPVFKSKINKLMK